jgi:GcrA cell cycle regulator
MTDTAPAGSGWTEDRLALLRRLWSEPSDGGKPLTTIEIAKIMRISKNVVIGRARRLGLPGRQNPIIRAPDDPRRKHPPKKPAPPVLPVPQPEPPQPKVVWSEPPEPQQEPPPPEPLPLSKPEQAWTPKYSPPKPSSCMWVVGEPGGGRKWHYCGAPTRSHREVYCEEHAKAARPRPAPRLNMHGIE